MSIIVVVEKEGNLVACLRVSNGIDELEAPPTLHRLLSFLRIIFLLDQNH